MVTMNEYVLEQRNLIKYAMKQGYVSPNTLKAWVNNVITNNERKRGLMEYIDELSTNHDDGSYHGVEE